MARLLLGDDLADDLWVAGKQCQRREGPTCCRVRLAWRRRGTGGVRVAKGRALCEGAAHVRLRVDVALAEQKQPAHTLKPVDAQAAAWVRDYRQPARADESLRVLQVVDDGAATHEQGVCQVGEREVALVIREHEGLGADSLRGREPPLVEVRRCQLGQCLREVIGRAQRAATPDLYWRVAQAAELCVERLEVVANGPLRHAEMLREHGEARLPAACDLACYVSDPRVHGQNDTCTSHLLPGTSRGASGGGLGPGLHLSECGPGTDVPGPHLSRCKGRLDPTEA